MQTTIITCDRCKKSAETEKEKQDQNILIVAIGTWNNRRYSSSPASFDIPDVMYQIEWCESCREQMGLYYRHPDKPVTPMLPTLEDMIREIATEATLEAIRN